RSKRDWSSDVCSSDLQLTYRSHPILEQQNNRISLILTMHVLTDYSVVRAPPFQRISLNPLRLVLLSIYLLVTYSLMSTPFYQLPKIHPNLQFSSITSYIKRTTFINHSLVKKHEHKIHDSTTLSTPLSTCMKSTFS